jgi:hypothetical protein
VSSLLSPQRDELDDERLLEIADDPEQLEALIREVAAEPPPLSRAELLEELADHLRGLIRAGYAETVTLELVAEDDPHDVVRLDFSIEQLVQDLYDPQLVRTGNSRLVRHLGRSEEGAQRYAELSPEHVRHLRGRLPQGRAFRLPRRHLPRPVIARGLAVRQRGSSRRVRPTVRRTRRAAARSPGRLGDDDPPARPPLTAAERAYLRAEIDRRRRQRLRRQTRLERDLFGEGRA